MILPYVNSYEMKINHLVHIVYLGTIPSLFTDKLAFVKSVQTLLVNNVAKINFMV